MPVSCFHLHFRWLRKYKNDQWFNKINKKWQWTETRPDLRTDEEEGVDVRGSA